METSRLRANMKQKCAKTMHVPTKTVWLSWREIVLIFPCLHPLLLNLIYKLPCIFKQKVFWNEKKTNWRKMSKKTSKSFESRHSFPNGCDIFQQEKAWSWHFPRSFNCNALGFLWRERKQFSFTNLDNLSHLYRVLFTVGFPLIWELAATFRALQTPDATRRIFPSSQDGNSQVSKRI